MTFVTLDPDGRQDDGRVRLAALRTARTEAVASRNLLARPVGAAAVADAVAFLIGARGVTGQNLFVDCGQRFLPSARDVMFETRCG